jgi:4-diphosphocytidyl-2-C-methyl-D-erythritol kinase
MTVDPTRRLAPVVRVAPAKLNLTLAIGGRRPDGFHELASVMVPLAFGDRLSLAPLAGGADTLAVDGPEPCPTAENLVLRAIVATRAALGGEPQPGGAGTPPGRPAAPWIAARLEKRVPVAAGLAGGSSDAAAALDGSLEAWGAELAAPERARVAAALGSDVPFFLAGGPALVEGRGERVTPLAWPTGPAVGVLLVTPALPVSTAEVFAAFDGGARSGAGAAVPTTRHLADELRGGLASHDLLVRAGILATANDLARAAAVVEPGLVRFRRALGKLVRRPIGQSGSGPTLWALYPSESDAAGAAEIVRSALADGRLDPPGSAEPFVVATAIVGHSQEGSEP